MLVIRKRDRLLLFAFCAREVQDFRVGWDLKTPEAQKLCFGMYKQISKKLRKLQQPAASWYVVNSLGNTGCVVRTLKLEAAPFDGMASDIQINLNPSGPRGSIYVGS